MVEPVGPDAVAHAENPRSECRPIDRASTVLGVDGGRTPLRIRGLIRGFLGGVATLNFKYRQREVHVAVGVEYYIHVPQVKQGSCIQQQQFSASMVVEHHCEFVWQPQRCQSKAKC